MFCSFTRNPLVLRLFGRTRNGAPGSALWQEFSHLFETYPGARQIIAIDVELAQTACGFGVPQMSLTRHRSTLSDYWRAKGDEATADYRDEHNKRPHRRVADGLGREVSLQRRPDLLQTRRNAGVSPAFLRAISPSGPLGNGGRDGRGPSGSASS